MAVNKTIEDINNFRQNHPELIVRDLAKYIDADVVRHTLKFRGINKWLRVRRLLIQLKSRWREDIKALKDEKKIARLMGDSKRFHRLQGATEMLIDCRQQVRALCHSPRDIDFPSNKHDFGINCMLPIDFPTRPHKRWFWNK